MTLTFQGADFCLAGLSFVLTGVLDSLEREEVEELIKKYGGRVLHQVSKKTDYVVVGDQSGPAKISKVSIASTLKLYYNTIDDIAFFVHSYEYIFRQIV